MRLPQSLPYLTRCFVGGLAGGGTGLLIAGPP